MPLERVVDDWRAIFLCPQNCTAGSTAENTLPPPAENQVIISDFFDPADGADKVADGSPTCRPFTGF